MDTTKRHYHLNKQTLDRQFEGVYSPEEMGTTGLVAWVLHERPSQQSPRNRWERLQRALRIIKGRGLDPERFCTAVMSTGDMYDINLFRMFKALERRGLAHRPMAGDC